jgi:hypothetical protein
MRKRLRLGKNTSIKVGYVFISNKELKMEAMAKPQDDASNKLSVAEGSHHGRVPNQD